MRAMMKKRMRAGTRKSVCHQFRTLLARCRRHRRRWQNCCRCRKSCSSRQLDIARRPCHQLSMILPQGLRCWHQIARTITWCGLAHNEPGLSRLFVKELRELSQDKTTATPPTGEHVTYCLLYTSAAADEYSAV